MTWLDDDGLTITVVYDLGAGREVMVVSGADSTTAFTGDVRLLDT